MKIHGKMCGEEKKFLCSDFDRSITSVNTRGQRGPGEG